MKKRREILERFARVNQDWCFLIGGGKARLQFGGDKQSYVFHVVLEDLKRAVEKLEKEKQERGINC